MKVIGHRGAAGLALENTLASLELARLLGVDAIEFDVRLSADGVLVLAHDDDLFRVSGVHVRVSKSSLKDLRKVHLRDGSTIATLEEALQMAHPTPVIIEVKSANCLEELTRVISLFPKLDITVASRRHDDMRLFKDNNPKIRTYLVEDTRPIEVIQLIRQYRLDGVDLNYWVLNPLTYYLLKRHKLDLMVFTVNNRLIARLIRWLYPNAMICSDHPERFLKHPYPVAKTLSDLRHKPGHRKRRQAKKTTRPPKTIAKNT